ncbi:GNAT family N-acetyltransferase [uncultured Cellulomonas sp.]|uniref:GNAT family N-acetyltransferase n=1 Tax=uncultured Cellulomonas sp. TaxID=189682 RepID=UPI00261B6070|nr:GNAT family N-acetyltransferase [uncultured Cellulomonas sp.]
MSVRPARAADAATLESVCLLTGDAGQDATHLYTDPALLAHVYLHPYLVLEPGLAFVAADGDHVGGYVVGALDTADFERRCEAAWWPPLRDRYPLDRWAAQGGADASVVRLIHHPPRADPAVLVDHPSHLHVDLLPGWQGQGLGRRLLETLFDALAAGGSRGVHLVVARRNEPAVGFYRRMGLAELAGDDGSLTLGRRFG